MYQQELSLCIVLIWGIWIMVIVSDRPISVKALGYSSDIIEDNRGEMVITTMSVITVCSKDALLSVQKVSRQLENIGNGNISRIKIQEDKVRNVLRVPKYWMSTNKTEKFITTVEEPKCRGFANHQTLKQPGADELTESGENASTTHFYPNGYFRNNSHIYAPDEYCIESLSQISSLAFGTITLKLCKPDCGVGKKRPCIKKCCPLDRVFSAELKPACVHPPDGSTPFMPIFYDDLYTKSKVYGKAGVPDMPITADTDVSVEVPKGMPHFIVNHPKSIKKKCVGGKVLPITSSEMSAKFLNETTGKLFNSHLFRIRTDGALMYKSLDNKCDVLSMTLDTYCIDGLIRALSLDPESPFNNTEDEYIIFQCHNVAEKDAHMDRFLSFTFGLLLLTTSIFPLVTCVVYILLWKKQNIHGWTIAATSGSLFFMYIFQGMVHLIGVTLKEKALNTFYCRFLAVLTHFFMMSTFTWCSVMTFDLFITFRSVVPMNQRLQGVSRYIKYSAFGWLVPLAFVVVGILMDFVIYTSNDCSYHAVPAYGQQSCWIVESSLGEYLYYPAGFLLCVNISLFTATCVKLAMYGRGTRGIRGRKNNEAFGECFSRFSKLFCVMGISWIFEILSWYVDGLGFVWYWNIIDVFNILRAVAVFAIYVCKPDIIKQLEDSYPTLQRMFRPFSRLFTRKCSDEISTESTVMSAAVSSSPAIQMKTVNSFTTSSCESGTNSRKARLGG